MRPEYTSEQNRSVPPARLGEFRSLRIGPIPVSPPVILAPMAGVTNYPFRRLCREQGAGLFVSEMITARPLVEQSRKTLKLADFGPDEAPRSLQLYGVDPYYLGEAVRILVGEGRVDHIDMNFGCPVKKVTRRGGGAAIPAKPRLLRRLVHAAVQAAGSVPVTLKFRIGLDERYVTFLETGHIAESEGASAIALHARTAAQLYDGEANWAAIGELKARVTTIPVLGNGDIWESADALRMMRQTDCDGVVVGRGCLGRPWLFHDLAEHFAGREPRDPPSFGEVADIMREHARSLAEWFGESIGVRMFRRHAGWYTKGFRNSSRVRIALMNASTLEAIETALADIDRNEPFPPHAMRVPRGKTGGTQRVVLPAGYLDNLDDDRAPVPEVDEDCSASGG